MYSYVLSFHFSPFFIVEDFMKTQSNIILTDNEKDCYCT